MSNKMGSVPQINNNPINISHKVSVSGKRKQNNKYKMEG
jgi:hypothetical protein